MNNYIKTLNGYEICDEKARKDIENLTSNTSFFQSDWNQNDPTAPDYIKNKPFYDGGDIEEIIFPETTYNCNVGDTFIQETITVGFKEDDVYNIYINGIEYILNCNYTTDGLIIYSLGDANFSNAPFHIKYIPMISLFNITFKEALEVTEVSICIKKITTNIIQLDRKYVNGIAGKDVKGNTYLIDDIEYTALNGAEIFNDYDNNIAVGQHSHAEGILTKAIGNASHAEGNLTISSGAASHAEGASAKAIGDYSHAEGMITNAIGDVSHAEGWHTIASGESQHVQGKYNIEDTENKYAHIVGNGVTEGQRSNAHTLDWDGNAWYSGDVYIGGTGQDDENAKKLATEESVNKLSEHKINLPKNEDETINYGEAGQFAVSDGQGGITWKTLTVWQGGAY